MEKLRLSVDLCLSCGSVALSKGGKLLSSSCWEGFKRHAEQVFIQIENCLKAAGVDKEELEEVVVTAGPGSFTGVRLSVTVGKAFKSYGIPVLATTTLDALSRGYRNLGKDVVPIIPGRKGRFYSRISGELLDKKAEELADRISKLQDPLIVYLDQLPAELAGFPAVREIVPLAIRLSTIPEGELSKLCFYYIRKPDAKKLSEQEINAGRKEKL
ncbi:MAG: tRNA (adenosine(37)-N6)-threonylcarbamoyltransferase complex dimerization subunit type 1 TsaB [Desulfurobacteriaceae bacterium]